MYRTDAASASQLSQRKCDSIPSGLDSGLARHSISSGYCARGVVRMHDLQGAVRLGRSMIRSPIVLKRPR